MARVYIQWEQLFKDYKRKKIVKARPVNKYAGLEECRRNVKKCNCSGKLAYC